MIKRKPSILLLSLVILFVQIYFSSCGKNDRSNIKKNVEKRPDSTSSIVKNTDSSGTRRISDFKLGDFYSNDSELTKWTEKIFSGLNDKERIGQMIITSAGNLGKSEGSVEILITQKKIGGVLLLGGSKESFTSLIRDFSKVCVSSGSLPLVFSADAEPSLINTKISGIKKFKPANEITTTEECGNTAKDIDYILKEIGVNQNYAPVCDFPYNKEIIGNRSFGSNIGELKKLADEFIDKTQSGNIVATAKHFPGHGNVKGDSHKELVFIDGELKELDQFKEAISSGVISVMVGHIAVRNNKDYDTKGLPSTLSYRIVTGLLRNELGFKGIIITDGMNMGALKSFPSPSFMAIKAGCDLILMPSDETKLITSVYDEMMKDPKLKEQVYSSVKRIIRMKICLGQF